MNARRSPLVQIGKRSYGLYLWSRPIAGGALLVGAVALFFVNVEQFNRFEGGEDAVFELDEAALAGAVGPFGNRR